MKPYRVFLSLTPVAHKRPAGADPFTYRDTRPLRYRASWWTRSPGASEMYRSKIVATEAEAVSLARKWLAQQNKAETRYVDTTDQPGRFGYSHESSEKKTPRQLEAEIAEALAKEPSR